MTTLEKLPEIVSGKRAAEALGKSVWWLRRRWNMPIYKPNKEGEYTRRQVELIVLVAEGTYTPERAHQVFQAEQDAERARGALTIANERKRRGAK